MAAGGPVTRCCLSTCPGPVATRWLSQPALGQALQRYCRGDCRAFRGKPPQLVLLEISSFLFPFLTAPVFLIPSTSQLPTHAAPLLSACFFANFYH